LIDERGGDAFGSEFLGEAFLADAFFGKAVFGVILGEFFVIEVVFGEEFVDDLVGVGAVFAAKVVAGFFFGAGAGENPFECALV